MALKKIWNILSPYIPKKFILVGVKILCLYLESSEKNKIKETGFSNLPPPYLRFKAHGMPFLERFLRRGEQASKDLQANLAAVQRNLNSFGSILDFGCGCGRILIWLDKLKLPSKLYGTDIDAEVIPWCQENLKFASFSINSQLPPLNYPAEMFDLVYASAVFIHLNEDEQSKWLAELKRITKDKGIIIITILGRSAWDLHDHKISTDDFEKRGIAYQSLSVRQFPITYQTEKYTIDNFSKYFKILRYIQKGMNDVQDVVILQR